MDSLPTSSPTPPRVGFLDSTGQRIERPAEWSVCFFELPRSDAWSEYSVSVNGRRLEISQRYLAGRIRTVAEWPRAGTGNYRLTWRLGNRLDVREFSIQPAKLSRSSFATMLEDLESRLPASIAIRLRAFGALSGLEEVPPERNTIDQEIVRLTRAVEGTVATPGLAAVLRQLSREHHVMLTSREDWVPVERARRPPPARIAAALYRGSNIAESEIFPGGIGPLRVFDARVEETADVYENRLVKTFWYEVALRLRRVAAVVGAAEGDTRYDRVAQLQEHLGRVRRQAGFLDDVQLLQQPPVNLTMVLLRKPPYRAALTGYRQLHRDPRIYHQDSRLDAPLRNLPTLYQLWCTLGVLDQLLSLAAEAGYELVEQRLVRQQRNTGFVRILPDGKPVLVLRHDGTGTVIRAIPERTYGRSGELRSRSFSQIPDLAIEVRRPGVLTALYVFDPKYKLDGDTGQAAAGRPKKVDIDKMHAYRDAIRDGQGRRVVKYAAILYPGKPERYGSGLEAVRGVPGEISQFAVEGLSAAVRMGLPDPQRSFDDHPSSRSMLLGARDGGRGQVEIL